MQFMRATVRELFHELADVPRAERERILLERGIGAELRAEVESLLSHDLTGESYPICIGRGARSITFRLQPFCPLLRTIPAGPFARVWRHGYRLPGGAAGR